MLAAGQVRVERTQDGYNVISSIGSHVELIRSSGKAAGAAWQLVDPIGGGRYAAAEDDVGKATDGEVATGGGYQSTSDEMQEYERALQYLADRHDAVVRYDEELDAHWITFPHQEDPVGYFFEVISTEHLEGRVLAEYFGWVEVPSLGEFGDPGELAKPVQPRPFPNDEYYPLQWYLRWTRLDLAQFHPAGAKTQVKVAVIDSPVDQRDQDGEALDGANINFIDVAERYMRPVPHGLGILSMLADQSNDGSGIVGLMGSWSVDDCRRAKPFFADHPPELRSYGVGDLWPISTEVAKAIRAAVDDGVDVINLSLSLAPSPSVQEAIEYAYEHNVIVIAAAGNFSGDATAHHVAFPASLDEVIGVAAAGTDRIVLDFSGVRGADISAGGAGVVVAGWDDTWTMVDGTSFAAAQVTATVAMMRAARPRLTTGQAKLALKWTAQKRWRNGGVGFLSALSALNVVVGPRHWAFEREIQAGAACQVPHSDVGNEQWYTHASGPAGKSALVDDYDTSVDAAIFGPEEQTTALPEKVLLEGSYPNPFNPSTTIRFELPESRHVRLAVYNMLGQEVAVLVDDFTAAGRHEAQFVADGLPSGAYIVRLSAGSASLHHKVVLTK